MQGARLRFNSLLLQIMALRTALHQIDGLVKAGAAEKHHQLTTDMGTCLTCCEPLLETLDKDCKRLAKDDGPLLDPTFLVRLKTAFNGGPATDMEALLDRQTNALNLLLTAYSCQSLRLQGQILQDTRSRKALRTLASDVLSLRKARDCDSMVSEISDTLSKLSREFAFDSAVLATRTHRPNSIRNQQTKLPPALARLCSSIRVWMIEKSLRRAHVHVTSASVLPLKWLVNARFQKMRAKTSNEHTDDVSTTSAASIDLSAAGHLPLTPYLFSAPSACDSAAYNWVHIGRQRLPSGLFQPKSVFYVLDLPTQGGDNLSGLLTKVRASIAATLVEQQGTSLRTLYFIAIVLQRGRRGMLDFGSQMQLENFRAEAQTLYPTLCVDFTVPDREVFWDTPWEHIRAIDFRARTDELNGHCFFGRGCRDWGAPPRDFETPMSDLESGRHGNQRLTQPVQRASCIWRLHLHVAKLAV
ncbi:hypothetical protein LMH87_010646 [Akanthomyces muscarius]|uniref:Uncharacterized protein n=1 Tax=Akanthomyces muscarius TaxID=2231603 RepID=A0A9W8QE67_AKAMU|nr:hypothetical protein LMH87_010646 [Akanthomyces muscarius]KAJ4154186.1 hypothetical protein LMH87_010646 [Akanthomyces muscarius]